jgi:uncharacterized protein (DUF2062 family)
MPRRFFRRISDGYLRNDRPWYLKPFDALTSHPTYFAPTRRGIAGAIWVGVFVALLPIPGQTLVALLAALALRVNLPLAAIATWVTNPITIVPIFYWEYSLGTVILQLPPQPFDIELSWNWVTDGFIGIWKPLMLGSFITATLVSSMVYIGISVTWRWMVAYRFKRRHDRTRANLSRSPKRPQR